MCQTLLDDEYKSNSAATQELGSDSDDNNPFISYHMWLYVTGPAKINHVDANYTELYCH